MRTVWIAYDSARKFLVDTGRPNGLGDFESQRHESNMEILFISRRCEIEFSRVDIAQAARAPWRIGLLILKILKKVEGVGDDHVRTFRP